MSGTNVFSVFFYAIIAIIVVVVVFYLKKTYQNFLLYIEDNENHDKATILLIIKVILLILIFVVIFNVGWNILQSVVVSSSNYQNPVELSEKQNLKKFQLPSQKEMDSVREQRRYDEIKFHQDALNSFDKSMQEEADKIRKRSEN